MATSGRTPPGPCELAGRLLTTISDGLGTLTYPGLRERVQFVADLLERDLGLSAEFIEAQIAAFLNDIADRITALDDGGDDKVRRQRRVCAATFRRLARFLQANFHFPGLDVDGLTRALYNLLQQAGITEVIRQARCALSEFETAVAGVGALGAALPDIGARSVGAAAIVELSGQPLYAWYPSWLLADEDLPLLGLSSLKNAARLIVKVRDDPSQAAVCLRELFTAAQLASLAGVAVGTEPTEDQKLTVLAVLNKAIQGPLIYDSERFPSMTLPADLSGGAAEGDSEGQRPPRQPAVRQPRVQGRSRGLRHRLRVQVPAAGWPGSSAGSCPSSYSLSRRGRAIRCR